MTDAGSLARWDRGIDLLVLVLTGAGWALLVIGQTLAATTALTGWAFCYSTPAADWAYPTLAGLAAIALVAAAATAVARARSSAPRLSRDSLTWIWVLGLVALIVWVGLGHLYFSMVLLLLLSGQPIAGTIVFASLVLPSLVGLAILIWIGERARKSPSPARAAVSAALFAAALFAASLIVIVGLHLAGCGRF